MSPSLLESVVLTLPFPRVPLRPFQIPPLLHSFCPSPATCSVLDSHRQLAAAKAKEKAEDQKEDSTGYSGVGAAEAHGNKPSRGAQIDAEVRRDPLSLWTQAQRT